MEIKDLLTAPMMSLDRRRKSKLSSSFIDDIKTHIEELEKRTRSRRKEDQISFDLCVEAITADLTRSLFNETTPWLYRSMRSNSFTGSVIGFKTFRLVIGLMEAAGMIVINAGGNARNAFKEPGDGAPAFHPGLATRMRASDTFKSIAIEKGFSADNYNKHFLQIKPNRLVSLRASSSRHGAIKVNARPMQFEPTEKTEEIRLEVKEINDFLFKQKLSGGVFTGFQRIFNEGDRRDFDWNMGGRLYCLGDDNYQMMKKQGRLNMKINGRRVAEVDINASWLTILHALLDVPLPRRGDLYHVKGYDRSVIKGWITATLGFEHFHTRWPPRMRKSITDAGVKMTKHMSMQRVGDAVMSKYPFLSTWPEIDIRWSRLMYEEAMCVTDAMRDLRLQGITSYPVHDSLIVPVRNIGKAKAALENAYLRRLGVKCRLSVNRRGKSKAP